MSVCELESQKRKGSIGSLLIAVLLCLLFTGLQIWRYDSSVASWNEFPFPDEKTYYLAGAKLFLEQGFSYFLSERSLWSGPGNILYIAGFSLNGVATKLSNFSFLALTALFIWQLISTRLGIAFGLSAVLLFLLHEPFSIFIPTLLTEPLYMFFLFLSIWILSWKEDKSICFLAGILLGLGTLVRPTTQYFPFFLFFLTCFWSLLKREGTWRSMQLKMLSYVLGSFFIILPWVIKNGILFDKWGIATGSGAVLYLGNDLRKGGDEPVYSNMDFDTYEITAPFAHLDREGDKRLHDAAIGWMKAYPEDIFLLSTKKFFKFFFGTPLSYVFPSPDFKSYVAHHGFLKGGWKAYEIVSSLLIAIFGLSGLLLVFQAGFWGFVAASLVLYFALLHMVAFPIPRMSLPIFPLLLIGALYWGRECFCRFQYRKLIPLLVGIGLSIFYLFLSNGKNSSLVFPESRKYFSSVKEFDSQAFRLHHLRKDIDEEPKGLISTGSDPYIRIKFPSLITRVNQVLYFDLKVIGAPEDASRALGQLFWRGPSEKGFAERRRSDFLYELDGEWHTYRVSPSLHPKWKGEITELRLDFPDGMEGVRYIIREVSLRR